MGVGLKAVSPETGIVIAGEYGYCEAGGLGVTGVIFCLDIIAAGARVAVAGMDGAGVSVVEAEVVVEGSG